MKQDSLAENKKLPVDQLVLKQRQFSTIQDNCSRILDFFDQDDDKQISSWSEALSFQHPGSPYINFWKAKTAGDQKKTGEQFLNPDLYLAGQPSG